MSIYIVWFLFATYAFLKYIASYFSMCDRSALYKTRDLLYKSHFALRFAMTVRVPKY